MSPGCSSGPEFRFGEGRISGVSSLALGVLSLLAVLCFRFPEPLTTPDLRAVYPLPRVRAVLLGAMLLSLALPSATAPTSRSAAVAGSGTTSKRLCTAAESPGLSSKVMGFGEAPTNDDPGRCAVGWSGSPWGWPRRSRVVPEPALGLLLGVAALAAARCRPQLRARPAKRSARP